MSPPPRLPRRLPGLLALLLPCAALAAGEPAGKPAPVGEKPTAQTADQTFLRDQAVLLPRGRQTVELSLSYARSVLELGGSRLEGTGTEARLSWRLGIFDDVQIAARLPWRYQRLGAFFQPAPAPVPGDPELPGFSTASSRQALGDLSLGAFAVVLRERAGWPNLVLGLDGLVPTGPGESGLGGGLAATKSYDPVILFCGLAYTYGFSPRPGDAARTLSRHNFGFNAGVAFAMNESVAVTGQVLGAFSDAESASPPRPLREQYRLQLGVTLLVTPRLFVEPTLAVAVGTASPDVTFGLNVPLTL